MASSAHGYQSIWLQKVASLARLIKYLVAKDSFIGVATSNRHTLSGCKRHPVLSVPVLPGWKRCAVLTMYATGWKRCTVLTTYKFNRLQVARAVLCSPCIYSIGCRLQEMYCAHHVCSILQKTHATYGCLWCTTIRSVFLFSAVTFSVFSPLFPALHVLFLLLFFIQS